MFADLHWDNDLCLTRNAAEPRLLRSRGGALMQGRSKPAGKAALEAAPAIMPVAPLVEFCSFHEGYVSRNIQLADTKAGLVLVAFSGMVALSLRDHAFLHAIRQSFLSFWPFHAGFSETGTLAWVTLLLSAPAIIIAFLVIVPRTSSGRTDTTPRGVTYWGDVAARQGSGGGPSYVLDVRALSSEQLVEDRLLHLYQLSIICARKMKLLQASMWIGGAGVMVAMLWVMRFAEHLG